MTEEERYPKTAAELARVADLLSLIPSRGESLLDVGARYGRLSRLLVERFGEVTALDLETPSIDDARIRCLQGNVLALDLEDDSFDVVLCAEVLEHIESSRLPKACAELARVSRRTVVVGVPYKQDLRIGRTTCRSCGRKNPPWGHVSVFDERALRELFPQCTVEKISLLGTGDGRTNFLSAFFMDLAGNPWGAYDQIEPCLHCGARLFAPPRRTPAQKVCSKLATLLRKSTESFFPRQANWMHVRFVKK